VTRDQEQLVRQKARWAANHDDDLGRARTKDRAAWWVGELSYKLGIVDSKGMVDINGEVARAFTRDHLRARREVWPTPTDNSHGRTEENIMATRKRSTKPTRGGSSGSANPRNSRDDGRITEAQHDDAMRVLRAEYYQGVRSAAESVAELVAEGMDENDATHQVVDGSYWVIYTHANFQVLMCSDHHDAYSEEYGEPALSGSDINWAALAYAAMAQDVGEQVQAGGTVDEAPRRGGRALGHKISPRSARRGR
jgi:hypothetical protein